MALAQLSPNPTRKVTSRSEAILDCAVAGYDDWAGYGSLGGTDGTVAPHTIMFAYEQYEVKTKEGPN